MFAFNFRYRHTEWRQPVLAGAALNLVLVSFLLWSGDEPPPHWPALWWVRPLLLLPIAGACAGFCHFLLQGLRLRRGWAAAAAYLLSVLTFLFSMWMGTIIGFDGTYWN